MGQCSVCTNDYDGSTYVPKSMPCGHSLCLRCISKLDPRKCPNCKKTFETSQLRDNFALMEEPVSTVSRMSSSEASQQEIMVHVHTMNGRKIKVFTRTDEIVRELKKKVFNLTGIMEDSQHLLFGGKKLEDPRRLSYYKIVDGVVIQLGVTFLGGRDVHEPRHSDNLLFVFRSLSTALPTE